MIRHQQLLSPARKRLLAAAMLLLGLELAMARVAIANPQAVDRGSDVYDEECAECHSLREGKNKKGPSLFAAIERKAGTIIGYRYSDALKSSDFVWTTEKMEAYITHPKVAVPGGKMKYEGLDDAQARADLLAFLATVH